MTEQHGETVLGVGCGEPSITIRPWRIQVREAVGGPLGCLLSLTRCTQIQGTNMQEMESFASGFSVLAEDCCQHWYQQWPHTTAYLQTYQKQETQQVPKQTSGTGGQHL